MAYTVEQIRVNNRICYLLMNNNNVLVLATMYSKFLEQRHMSPNTVRRVIYSISYYYSFLEDKGINLLDVSKMQALEVVEHFNEFREFILKKASRELNYKTVEDYIRDVVDYYYFLYIQGKATRMIFSREEGGYGSKSWNHKNDFKWIFRSERYSEEIKRIPLTESELEILIATATNVRDRVLLKILNDTGVRIGEALSIRVKDIHLKDSYIRIFARDNNLNGARNKNHENRPVAISNETRDELKKLIKKYSLEKEDFLFQKLSGAKAGTPMTVSDVYAVFRRLSDKTGISTHPHAIRHLFGDKRRAAGWRIEDIQKAYGHKSPTTTEGYLGEDEKRLIVQSTEYFNSRKDLYDIGRFK